MNPGASSRRTEQTMLRCFRGRTKPCREALLAVRGILDFDPVHEVLQQVRVPRPELGSDAFIAAGLAFVVGS